MEDNILCKIHHFPLIITKILNYSLKRPFILHYVLAQSEGLKEKLNKLKLDKYNSFSKEINDLFSFSNEILSFKSQYDNIMTKEIKIEEEEFNFYITKPYINTLFDFYDKLFSYYKKFININSSNIEHLFAESLFEFCLSQPYITLSINLFSKNNNFNDLNMELRDADLDYNFLKYLNINRKININAKQKMKLCINIYNKYSKIKIKEFKKNEYYNNIDLLKDLNIEEIYFIRPNIKEEEKIENILYKNEIIDEINIMFILLKELKNKNELIKIYFTDNIIKNISLYYNEIKSLKILSEKRKEFKNLKNIGISSNLINGNIKNIIYNFFNYNLAVIYYKDIIKNDIINNMNIFDNDTLYINLEHHMIYDMNLYKFLSNIFSIKNSQFTEKIKKIEIIYNCEDINLFYKNNSDINNNLFKKEVKNNCILPHLNEIIIKNNINKVYKPNILNNKNISLNKIFNFINFICSYSKNLSSIIIQDSYIPFNIFDYNNININSISLLNLKSPSLNIYTYSEIIERINRLHNIQYITIDTLSSNFNDSFDDIKINKNLKNLKEFIFNDFFVYKNVENNRIIFKQNCSIDKDLVDIFSEIIENEKNLERIELNGFHYNLDKIKNENVKNLELNLEENDKQYKIRQIKFNDINLKLNNFPNLNTLYIYIDILHYVDDIIQLPLNPNLKRIFLFSSYMDCDINSLDDLLKKNGVELIVRIIDSYNKGMIMAYIASFPNIQ